MQPRAPSDGFLRDKYNETATEEASFITKQINSYVSPLIILDWTFDVAGRIKAGGDLVCGCELNLLTMGGNLMFCLFQETPSVIDARLELELVQKRHRDAGIKVVCFVVDDLKYEGHLLEIFVDAHPSNGGCGVKLGFFHLLDLIRKTCTDGPETERFLSRLSNAIKYRDAKAQENFVKVVTDATNAAVHIPVEELLQKPEALRVRAIRGPA